MSDKSKTTIPEQSSAGDVLVDDNGVYQFIDDLGAMIWVDDIDQIIGDGTATTNRTFVIHLV